MARSTKTQQSERLNAAHGLIAQGLGMAEAAAALARRYGLSRRHAYRYLEKAQSMQQPAPIAEPAMAVTFKLPVSMVCDLRAYAKNSEMTQSEIVSEALSRFLAAEREHG